MDRRPLVLLAALASVGAGCLGAFGSPDSGKALEFALTTTDGRNVTADDYRGRVVVLDLMATWCAPCKAEMPHLREFRAATNESDVALLSIDVDPTDKDANGDPLPRFKDEFNATWEFAYDAEPTRESVFFKTGARVIPTIVVLDREGVVRERITEYPLSAEALAEKVEPYLTEAA